MAKKRTCDPQRWLVCDTKQFPWWNTRFKTYRNYLQSALWFKIRERVLKRDDHVCLWCGKRAQVVHHRCYTKDVIEGRDDDQLVSLCHSCHAQVEFTREGTQRGIREKDAVLLRLAA